jgi:hypothetical protein
METGSIQVGMVLAEKVNSEYVLTKIVNSEILINSNYIESQKLSAKKWIGFNSSKTPGTHPYRLFLETKNSKERLVIGSTHNNSTLKLMIFDNERIYMNGTTNIQSKKIQSPIGTEGDIEGDISIDKNFVYYCTKNFDGVNKIWKRCPLTDWE